MAVLFIACGKAVVRPGTPEPGFSLAALREDTIALVVSGDVRVEGFQRAFDKAYGNGDALATALAARMLDSLNLGVPKVPAKVVSAEQAANSRFVVRVRSIVIRGFTREVPTALIPGYGENTKTPAGGGTSEGCEVTAEVEVWESAPEGSVRRYAFTVFGRADVPLYAYKSALREAVRVAAIGAARHLRAR